MRLLRPPLPDVLGFLTAADVQQFDHFGPLCDLCMQDSLHPGNVGLVEEGPEGQHRVW